MYTCSSRKNNVAPQDVFVVSFSLSLSLSISSCFRRGGRFSGPGRGFFQAADLQTAARENPCASRPVRSLARCTWAMEALPRGCSSKNSKTSQAFGLGRFGGRFSGVWGGFAVFGGQFGGTPPPAREFLKRKLIFQVPPHRCHVSGYLSCLGLDPKKLAGCLWAFLLAYPFKTTSKRGRGPTQKKERKNRLTRNLGAREAPADGLVPPNQLTTLGAPGRYLTGCLFFLESAPPKRVPTQRKHTPNWVTCQGGGYKWG